MTDEGWQGACPPRLVLVSVSAALIDSQSNNESGQVRASRASYLYGRVEYLEVAREFKDQT